MLYSKHCKLGKFYKYFIHFTKISTVVITVLFTLQYQNIQAQLYVAKGTEVYDPSYNINVAVADSQDTIHISKIYVVEGTIISGWQQNKLAIIHLKNDEIEKPKFTYQEQKDYETIESDIAALEEKIEKLESEMAAVSTDFVKLNQIMADKEAAESLLEEKMDRWMYLEELAARIAEQ